MRTDNDSTGVSYSDHVCTDTDNSQLKVVYAKTSGFLVRIMSANEKNGHTRSGNDQKKSISRVSQMRRIVNAGYGERTSLSEGFAEQRLNNKRPSL